MKIYLVGGAIRDQLLGLPIGDKDWVVVGSSENEMLALGFRKVGKGFPVFLHPETYEEYALARKEQKTGYGYHGFDFNIAPEISLNDDLIRRDLTINAMAMDEAGLLHDPFGGAKDIQQKILRHVSDAFSEDPLRIIRVARFAAKFHYLGFTIADETLSLMRKMTKDGELNTLSGERIYHEIRKAFLTPNPEIFFQILYKIDVFNSICQPLHNLFINQDQVFLPLRSAVRLNCYDVYTLFTLLIYQLEDQKCIVDIAETLKMPRALTRLMIDTHCYHNMINNLLKYNAPQILKMLRKTNALRDISYISKVIEVCHFIAKASSIENSTADMALRMIQALHGKSYQDIISKSHHSRYIGKQVESEQLRLIEEMLHAIKS